MPVLGNSELRPEHLAHDGTLTPLVTCLRDWQDDGWRVLLVCHQEGQAERLRDLLEPSGLALRWAPQRPAEVGVPAGLTITVGELPAGFSYNFV